MCETPTIPQYASFLHVKPLLGNAELSQHVLNVRIVELRTEQRLDHFRQPLWTQNHPVPGEKQGQVCSAVLFVFGKIKQHIKLDTSRNVRSTFLQPGFLKKKLPFGCKLLNVASVEHC